MLTESQTYSLPILPLESTVVFPTLAIPISIQKPTSINAVEIALESTNFFR